MAENTNTLVLEVCPTKLSGKHDKHYQKTKCAEITKAIDGLYNSGGGTIILRYKKAPPRKHVENCVRMLEQKIQEFLGTITLTYDVQFIKIQPPHSRAHGEIKIIVTTTTKTEHMTPLRYNIYLPSNQLLMEIQPHENVEKLRRFLVENTPSVTPIESDSHCKKFVKGTIVPFSESKMTQFKKVEDRPAAQTTFANRLICNKFPCYVSAFANYAGGYMYVGIDDEGKVEGELLTAEEKEKVKKLIRKAIKKMKWPKKREPADENNDARWDVHFEPVKDCEDNVIPSLYVVVIFIAQCRPAGVFTEEPECYEIVDNHKVQKVDFSSWKRTIDPRLAEEGTSCLNATALLRKSNKQHMAENTNTLVLDVCPTKLRGKYDKNYQKTKCAEIINAIDGLYNTGGGTIILRYKKAPPRKHVENCVRMLEQKIKEFLGTITLTYDVEFIKIQPSHSRAHGEMKIIVTTTTKTQHVTTLNYNIYLPSNQQIMEIQPHENVEKLRSFLVENTPSVKPIESGSHRKTFVRGTIVPFSESKTIQFKKVKDTTATRTTFANRLIGNKFSCYVSAFANYAGGYMYVGIDDKGKVEGEFLAEDEKEKVKKFIRTVIKKMKWPKTSEPADENNDARWDIHFEPVKDCEDNSISSLYVVVIFIAQCRPAGVFTEEPECYEIVDNHKVQKVDFASWKRTIDPRLAEEGTSPWELVYEDLTNRLNSNCNHEELHAASKTAQEKYKFSDVKLTCLSKLVSFHLRKGDYEKAEEVLDEYSKTLPKSTRSKVMEQYLQSIMARCKGEYKKSYEIAIKCLYDLKELPVSTMSAAFYVQIATLENILAMQTKNSKQMLSLFRKSEKTYDIAKSHLDELQTHSTTKAEYQQKIYINKALLSLGCSLSGDILPDSESCIDIEKAQEYLLMTQRIVIRQGYPLSKFRKIQSLFAYACLWYRMANDNQSRCNELLKYAVDYSKEAESLARELGFAEMMTYAKKFIELFEPKPKPSS